MISFIVIILMIVGFVSEIWPLWVTAMLGCVAFFVTGIISSSQVWSGFSNDTVFMIAGTMIVGEAMFQTGAAQFIGTRIVKAVGYNERRMIFVLVLAAGVLSAFTSNSSVMAMFIPLIRSVAASSDGRIKGKHVVMPVGISSMVGGACTIVGSTPQLVAQGLLEQYGLRQFTFFELGYIGWPLLLILALWFSTIWYKPLCKSVAWMPDEPDYIREMKQKAAENKDAEQKVNPRMYVCIGIVIVMVCLFLSGIWTSGTIAVISGLACIVTGCIQAKTAFQKMGWNSLVVVGATLGVAKGLNESGAAEFIARSIVNAIGTKASIWVIMAVFGFMVCVMSNLLSHTATISLLVPIMIPLAAEMGLDGTLFIYAIAHFVMCGYATPLGVASYAMTLSEGYSFKDYQKIGGPFNILAYIILVVFCVMRFKFGF